MKKKQTLAMLLAAAMVLSMPVGAYAEELDGVENSAGLVEPYIVDSEAPKLNGITLSSETVQAGENLTVTITAVDDLTGVDFCQATFVNKSTKRHLTTTSYDRKNPNVLTLETSEYEPSGTYELDELFLGDTAGNNRWYVKDFVGESGDDTVIEKLDFNCSFTVTNDGKVDDQPPELTTIKLSAESVTAGDSLTVTINATDDFSGIDFCQATFVNKSTKRHLTTTSYDRKNPNVLTLETSEYEPSGTYELDELFLGDTAGNNRWYVKDFVGESGDDTVIEKLDFNCSFTVTNDGKVDDQPPELTTIKLSAESVTAGDSLTVTINATDDFSGIDFCQATFVNKSTKRHLTTTSYDRKNPNVLTLETSEYEPSGTYELDELFLGDTAGNNRWYVKDFVGESGDDTVIEKLDFDSSFTVINDDTVTPPPTDPETPSTPTTPSRPNSSTTTAPGTPINYESEKPDPADEQAVEAYNFWQNTKREIRIYERAGSLRVYVPADVTYMPASVMETLRVENVPVVLQWQGHRIEIPAGKAQPKQPLKAYWPMKTLCELYNA